MSFELPSQHKHVEPRVRWKAAAFLIEAMLLLLFIMISLAILISMFGKALDKSTASADLSEAVALATASAERFSAHPAESSFSEEVGDLTVECRVVPEKHDAGTLFKAQISVYEHRTPAEGDSTGKLVYQISTSKYEKGVR